VDGVASVFSLTLGYSRVPYAAALDGNYFAPLRGCIRASHSVRSVLALAAVAALFCFLRLADLIAALVVIRILLQYLVQAVGVIVLRIRRPEMKRRFGCGSILACPDCRRKFHLHSGFTPRFLARDPLRGNHSGRGDCCLLCASWRKREWPFAVAQSFVSRSRS